MFSRGMQVQSRRIVSGPPVFSIKFLFGQTTKVTASPTGRCRDEPKRSRRALTGLQRQCAALIARSPISTVEYGEGHWLAGAESGVCWGRTPCYQKNATSVLPVLPKTWHSMASRDT